MSNSLLYDEILVILHERFKEHKISKVELERIIDSQFRVIRNSIGKKEAETTMLQYLGKIIPTKAHQRYVNLKRKIEGNNNRVDQCNLGES